MSPDDMKVDSKTIRLPTDTYFKLVELAGYFSAITGEQQSISEMAQTIIENHYDTWQPFYVKTISNPQMLAKYRQDAQHLKQHLREVYKNVKIKE